MDKTAVITALTACSRILAGTVGLNGRPEVRPTVFLFEQAGAFYFMTTKSCRMYAELCKTPYVQLYLEDPETQKTLRISGKACFTEDNEVIARAVREREAVLPETGGDTKRLIAFFLTGAEAEYSDACAEGSEEKFRLPDPDGVLIGITIKKDTELRDRLGKILERREQEAPTADGELLKLYDGALFVFAEAAKSVWPRMDIRPVERAAVFETYDEREKYTALAAGIIGNTVIDKPEDLTYWLNIETLKELLPQGR